METVLSLKGIAGIKKKRQGIMAVKEAGFTNVVADFSQIVSPDELERTGETIENSARRYFLSKEPDKLPLLMDGYRKECGAAGLGMPVAYAPYLRRSTKRDDLLGLLRDLTIRSIRYCGETDSRYLVIRPVTFGLAAQNLWEENKKFYLSFADEAKRSNVILLLKNQCRNVNGHLIRGALSDPAQASEWVDELNREVQEERFGFCFDLGICSICGQNPFRFLNKLGKRVKAVIIRDYHNSDISVLPYNSTFPGKPQSDWMNFIRGMRKIDFDGPLIFQIEDSVRLLPDMLKPPFYRLAKETADFFVWQIGMERMLRKYPQRVLFGAGNMCRTYLKNYGEDFPPLFTCDNNKDNWDTEFCGIPVKRPAALLNIPKDCAVIICNIYYNEIEDQLGKLGIKNPVERFSDLYMPTYYFDRLDMADVEGME